MRQPEKPSGGRIPAAFPVIMNAAQAEEVPARSKDAVDPRRFFRIVQILPAPRVLVGRQPHGYLKYLGDFDFQLR